jgi:hypothetical protein
MDCSCIMLPPCCHSLITEYLHILKVLPKLDTHCMLTGLPASPCQQCHILQQWAEHHTPTGSSGCRQRSPVHTQRRSNCAGHHAGTALQGPSIPQHSKMCSCDRFDPGVEVCLPLGTHTHSC